MQERPNDRRSWAWGALTIITIAIGLSLRLWILSSPAGRLDSDEAVVGLMGRWIADGHRVPLFFWGQHYGGTIESVLVAAGLKLHQGRLFVKAVPLALSALSAVILVRAARHVMSNEQARLAGAMLFAWPGTTWLATKERGFYWVGMLLACTALYCAARIVTGLASDLRVWALYGFTVGLAWYTNAQSVFILLPLTAWLVATHLELRPLAVATSGAFIGASPWLWGWAKYGSQVFEQPSATSSYFDRLERVAFTLVPRVLGLRTLFVRGWTLGPFGAALWIIALTSAIGIAVHTFRFRSRVTPFTQLLVILMISFPCIAAIPTLSNFVSEPRYGLYLVPIVALLAMTHIRRAETAALAVVVLVAVSLTATNTLVTMANQKSQRLLDLAPTDLAPIKRALSTREISRVYADYWLANPITFRNGDSIVASPLEASRVEWARWTVDASKTTVWIVYLDSARDRALPAEFQRRRIPVTREVDGEIAIYHLSRYLNPLDLGNFWSRNPAGK